MTEIGQHSAAVDATPQSRLEIQTLSEAEQRIAELDAQYAEQLERERVLEVENAALRRDVAVKVAYATALEQAAEERQTHIIWLQAHFDLERLRAERLSTELAAERARLSYRVARRAIAIVGRGSKPSRLRS